MFHEDSFKPIHSIIHGLNFKTTIVFIKPSFLSLSVEKKKKNTNIWKLQVSSAVGVLSQNRRTTSRILLSLWLYRESTKIWKITISILKIVILDRNPTYTMYSTQWMLWKQPSKNNANKFANAEIPGIAWTYWSIIELK